MKGIVFRLFEDFVCEVGGHDAWERILDSTELVTREPFVGPGSYPDADLMALVRSATSQLQIAPPTAVRAFGTFCLPRLLRAVPGLTDSYTHPKELLLALDGTIHVEVRKLWRDAAPPRFVTEDPAPDQLVLHYESKRRMCIFLEGLLDGTAAYYGVSIEREHYACTQRGAPRCSFRLRFSGSAGGETR